LTTSTDAAADATPPETVDARRAREVLVFSLENGEGPEPPRYLLAADKAAVAGTSPAELQRAAVQHVRRRLAVEQLFGAAGFETVSRQLSEGLNVLEALARHAALQVADAVAGAYCRRALAEPPAADDAPAAPPDAEALRRELPRIAARLEPDLLADLKRDPATEARAQTAFWLQLGAEAMGMVEDRRRAQGERGDLVVTAEEFAATMAEYTDGLDLDEALDRLLPVYSRLGGFVEGYLAALDLDRQPLTELAKVLGLAPEAPGEAPDPLLHKAPLALASPGLFPVGRRLAPFATGAPAYGAAKALLQARRWPVDEDGRPHFVHRVEGQHVRGLFHYQILVPPEPSGGDVTLAHAELARSILKDMGRDTAWLHMLLLAYAAETRQGEAAVIPRLAFYRALGLDKRTDIPRQEKDRRCHAELDRLRSLGLSVLHLYLQGKDLTKDVRYHRRTGQLWTLATDEFGQASLEAEGDRWVQRWDDWQVLARPGEWAGQFLYGAPLRQLGYLAKELFTHLDRRRALWGPDLAVYLAFEGRFEPRARLKVRNKHIVEFAGGDPRPADRERRRETQNRLKSAIEEQRAWGWTIDYSEWPEAMRPDRDADRADRLAQAGSDGTEATPRRAPRDYWADFINAHTVFIAPDDLLTWNRKAAAAKRPARKTAAPKGQPAVAVAKTLLVSNTSQALAADGAPLVTAKVLRDLRRRRGASLEAMARYLGVSRTLVSYMETGKRNVSPQVLERVRPLLLEPAALGLPDV